MPLKDFTSHEVMNLQDAALELAPDLSGNELFLLTMWIAARELRRL